MRCDGRGKQNQKPNMTPATGILNKALLAARQMQALILQKPISFIQQIVSPWNKACRSLLGDALRREVGVKQTGGMTKK